MTKWVRSVLAVAAVATLGVSAPAQADRGHHDGDEHGHGRGTVVYTLDDSSHGNPEGVAWDGRFFYVGATGDATIYRGTLCDHTVHTFIPGADGRSAVGMKVSHGWLYVAGGATGSIFVFNLHRPAAAPLRFETGDGGFLNDLVVTRHGDVYVTDSFRPTLWRIAATQLKPGGRVDAIDVSSDIPYAAKQFNLNGIVAFRGGRELVVVNSSNGVLYRIRFEQRNSPQITAIQGPELVGGDGMIKDRGRLIVVRGDPASLSFLKLKHGQTRAQLVKVRTDATLRGPSTVARADHRYLVVNADFNTGKQPFTVSGLDRTRHDS